MKNTNIAATVIREVKDWTIDESGQESVEVSERLITLRLKKYASLFVWFHGTTPVRGNCNARTQGAAIERAKSLGWEVIEGAS